MKEDDEEFEEEEDFSPGDTEEDDELFHQQLEKHPDYQSFLESGDPFEVYLDEQGQEVSPLLHITTHVVLEKQIRASDPVFVRQTVERMEARGDDPHEARHAIMVVLSELMWEVMTKSKPFDLSQYEKKLRRL